ncbi:MAG: hypothetical protein V1723_02480 [Candidatus Uhrbacteria bacterium]
MKKCVVLALACVLLGAACANDPDPETWRVSRQLDLARLRGVVTEKSTRAFLVDHPEWDHKRRDVYYCVQIKNDVGSSKYCGVQQELYDAVEVGMEFPTVRGAYTVYDLARLNGRVIDRVMSPNGPDGPTPYVIVDHASEIRMYPVDLMTYYRYVRVGMILPFNPPNLVATAAGLERTPTTTNGEASRDGGVPYVP